VRVVGHDNLHSGSEADGPGAAALV